MTSRLTLTIIGIVVVMSLFEFPNGVEGWWWGRRKKGGYKASGTSTEFGVYTCPLDGLAKKKCAKRGLLPYAPYGIKHTFIKLGDRCYEWGNWNYPRHLKCTDDVVACCYELAVRNYRGITKCAERIGEFENAWKNKGKKYGWWSWNCQRYTNAMKDFLNKCYLYPSDAIP